jgi:hypothetical protein
VLPWDISLCPLSVIFLINWSLTLEVWPNSNLIFFGENVLYIGSVVFLCGLKLKKGCCKVSGGEYFGRFEERCF